MEMLTGQQQETPQAEAKKPSLWEDIVDVFVAPAELYRRHEKDSFVVPWLVVSIIGAVLYYAFLSANKAIALAAMQAQLARQGVTEVPAQAQGFANAMNNLGGIIVPIVYVLMFLLIGLAIWVVGMIAKGGPTYRQAIMIPAWAALVLPLSQVLLGVLLTMKLNSGGEISAVRDASTGLLRFVGSDTMNPILQPVLGIVDLFWIWQAVLWFIALKAICRWPTGKAAGVALVCWLLIAVPGLIGAMIKLATGAA